MRDIIDALVEDAELPVCPDDSPEVDLVSVHRTSSAEPWITRTAALQRRKLVAVKADKADGRIRRVELMPAGRAVLARAYPIWAEAHGAVEAQVSPSGAGPLRNELTRLVKLLDGR